MRPWALQPGGTGHGPPSGPRSLGRPVSLWGELGSPHWVQPTLVLPVTCRSGLPPALAAGTFPKAVPWHPCP